MESLYIGVRYRIQTLKEAFVKCSQPQLTKGWAVTIEVLDSVQILLIASDLAMCAMSMFMCAMLCAMDKFELIESVNGRHAFVR